MIRTNRIFLSVVIVLCHLLVLSLAQAKPNKQAINIAYFTQQQIAPPVLTNLEPFVENKGLAGAELATIDNATTGKFTQQTFVLKTFIVPSDGNLTESYSKHIAGKFDFVVVNLPMPSLLAVADLASAKQTLLFDIATIDDSLRNEQCRHHVLHVLPNRAMRADALAQYMMKKRWTKWFLVVGTTPEDQLYATALKRAAKRFGIEIVLEKAWDHTFEARRSAQADVAVFSQVDDYDVLVVADEQDLFGDYLEYRTWLSRPVIGTQGLIATAWHKTHDLWGATQIQNRFKDHAKRWMEEQDYAAYLAVRAIGEAATRTKSNQLADIKAYLLSAQFALQGYKGVPLSFRSWDKQLRQPVLLAAPRSLVSVAPIEGFLHQKTELDTLGYDEPETLCKKEP